MSSLLNAFYNGYGGSIAGILLTSALFGVITVQTYFYFLRFPKDPVITKATVVALWVILVAQIACFVYAMWWCLIQNFGNFIPALEGSWATSSYQVFAVVSSVIVQVFFAQRVYYLSKNAWLATAVRATILVQFALGVSVAAASMRTPAPAAFSEKYTSLTVAWLVSEAVADTTIAGCMLVLLLQHKTGFQQTDSVIDRIIVYSMSTGLLTSVVALIILGVFAAKGFHFVVLVLSLPFGALYTIAMLSNLHTRATLIKRFPGHAQRSIPLSTMVFDNRRRTPGVEFHAQAVPQLNSVAQATYTSRGETATGDSDVLDITHQHLLSDDGCSSVPNTPGLSMRPDSYIRVF